MSCGKPHEVPCTQVLDRIYAYLDGELEDVDCAKVRQKHCGCEPVPTDLRAKVLVRIQEVRASIELTD